MTNEELKQENAALRWIIKDIWWMARRYADGRQTYATSMYNDAIRAAVRAGVELSDVDGTIFARDGGGRAYDGLTGEEAAAGREPDYWHGPLQREVEALRVRVAELEAERKTKDTQ